MFVTWDLLFMYDTVLIALAALVVSFIALVVTIVLNIKK